MSETKVIKINRRSANITEGKSRAPNRSMYYALGYEADDFKTATAPSHLATLACKCWPMLQ
jgi:dihydroxyacid dehydratase/phosphogluconate dehydratase